MTGDHEVRFSGAVELNMDVERLITRIVAGVVAGLLDASVGIGPGPGERGERYDPSIDHLAPPRFGDHTGEGGQR